MFGFCCGGRVGRAKAVHGSGTFLWGSFLTKGAAATELRQSLFCFVVGVLLLGRLRQDLRVCFVVGVLLLGFCCWGFFVGQVEAAGLLSGRFV